MTPRPLPLLAGLLALAATALPVRAEETGPIALTILAINDLHGNLKSPGKIKIEDPADPSKTIEVPVGGVEAMATLVKEKRAKSKNTVFVAAGDLVGASPLLSALFADEPTIESLSLMGLELSAVGNHEFDKGVVELLRKQNGGCSSDKACLALHPFMGAKYRYLAASTIDKTTGEPILPPYAIKTFEGVPVGFIGLALKGVPQLVSPSGIAGVEFRDEAETVNALVPKLKAQGVEAIVVLIHEGGFPTGGRNDCPGISGPIVDIVEKLDPAVRLVVSGHTHKAYVCSIDGRLVTSGDKFGSMVTEIGVTIDRTTKKIVETRAANLVVRTDAIAPDAEQTALVSAYEKVAGPLIARPVGRIAETLRKEDTPSGEFALGSLVADAQLAATREAEGARAEIALTNAGGIRTDLVKKTEDGTVTYGDVFAVQPFGNQLVTMTLSGAELHEVLEQQWRDQPKPRVLQVSKGFTYAWSASKPVGARIDPATMKLGGKPIEAKKTYRVTVNAFLADGGDGFTTLRKGRDTVTGMFDVEALEKYIAGAGTVVAAPAVGRVVRGE